VSQWFNYEAALKILAFGLLLGAGLPALFAVAVRVNSAGAGGEGSDGTLSQKNPMLAALSWAIFAVVLAMVLIGVLFIARDFIGHQTGLYLLGAKPK
jgi:cytochrome b